MRFLRPLSLIVLAAVLATAALSGLVFHEVSRASFIALPFAILGTAAVASGLRLDGGGRLGAGVRQGPDGGPGRRAGGGGEHAQRDGGR
jgi:hypothetical protein